MTEVSPIDLYRFDFRGFVEFAFRELYPGKPFIAGWHVDVLADRLTTCGPGGGGRLVINVPPRHLKSFCASITWPLFVIARQPGVRICVFSGSRELSADFAELRRRLLKSKRFRAVFPNMRCKQVGDTLRFDNGSELVQTQVLRSQIGRGADLVIIDDPISPTNAENGKLRSEINRWYDAEITPRLNNKKAASVVVVMQRLHPEDLCGHLARGIDPWETLVLPAVAANDEQWALVGGVTYSRSRGEALCLGLEDINSLHDRLEQVGGYNFYAQYLQAPQGSRHGSPYRWHGMVVYDGWKPGMPAARVPLFGRQHEEVIREEYFGIRPPWWMPGLRDATDDEWQEAAMLQQAKLMESCEEDRQRREVDE
jgi:hypothetical protein